MDNARENIRTYYPVLFSVLMTKFAVDAFQPPQAPDLYWQNWLGATILRNHHIPTNIGPELYELTGYPLAEHEWLFSILVALSHNSLWWLLPTVVASATIITIAIVFRNIVATQTTFAGTAVCISLVTVCLTNGYDLRAQCIAWAFTAAVLSLLRKDTHSSWYAIPIVIIWGWFHASVVLAPVLIALFTIGSFIDTRLSASTKRYAILTVLSALATIANPIGIGVPIDAYNIAHAGFTQYIVEWQATTTSVPIFTFGALPLLGIIAFGRTARITTIDKLLVVFAFITVLDAIRNIPIFAIIVGPIAAKAWFHSPKTTSARWKKTSARTQLIIRAIAVPFMCLFAIPLTAIATETKDTLHLTPTQASVLKYIQQLPGHHHLICDDWSICSEIDGNRLIDVYMDGRCDFPIAIWKRWDTIMTVKSNWKSELRATDADLLVTNKSSPISSVLSVYPTWSRIYTDSNFALWQKRENTTTTRREKTSGSRTNAAALRNLRSR